MMNKLIYPEANEQLFQSLEGQFSTIFTHDKFYQNVKTASSNSITKEMLEECKPDKDHMLVHFIAVGDYEKFGFNKNADAFPKLANEQYHKTFETNAKFYKEHASDDPKKAIGEIKKSCYNPDMGRTEVAAWINIKKASEAYDMAKDGKALSCSMGCFPEGTPISTGLFNTKPIQDIKVGDHILTATTQDGVVDDVYNYKYTGDKISFKAAGIYDDIICTSNHPFFIRRYKNQLLQDAPAICPVCGAHVNYLKTHIRRYKDNNHRDFWIKYEKSLLEYDELFVDASELQSGDYVVSPKLQLSNVSTEEDQKFARFLGYFVAEGNYVKYRGKNPNLLSQPYRAIQLNFNINENDYIDEVVNILKYFNPYSKITVQKREKKNICVISMYNRDFAYRVYQACGEHAWNKSLNFDVIKSWDKKCIELFLDAYVNGDGTFNKVINAITWTTVSKVLAVQLNMLAASIGLYVTTYTAPEREKNNNIKKRRVSYTGSVRVNYLPDTFRFSKITSGLKSNKVEKLTRPFIIVEDKIVLHRVTSILREDVQDLTVYNFSVKGEHTYIANNLLVHNCSVPEDRDSINGQLSPNPSKYTPWMKSKPGQFIDSWDGKPVNKYAFVYNDKPTFFDLSWVMRPAERIAHYLEYMFNDDVMLKAASIKVLNDKHIPYSADLAEEMGLKFASSNVLPLPKQELLDHLVDIEDAVNYVSTLKYASKDNPLEQYIFYKSLNNVYNTSSEDYSNINKKIASLQSVRPETLYRELADRAIILPFKSFMDVTYGNTKYASNESYNQAVKKAFCMLPKMFMILKDSMSSLDPDDIGSCVAENVFDACCAKDAFNDCSKDPVQKFMDEVEEKCSFDDDKVNERVIHITIKLKGNKNCEHLPEISIMKEASDKSEINKLAKRYVKEYALYKLAAINDIRAIRGSDFVNDYTLCNIVAQNLIG